MQGVYQSGGATDLPQRWESLKALADAVGELDVPHRWLPDNRPLGDWILQAREDLRRGACLDLKRALPDAVRVIRANNQARAYGAYQLEREPASEIRSIVRGSNSVLVLASQNRLVNSLRAFFGRRIPIWEGHTRDYLVPLAEAMKESVGDPSALCRSVVDFLQDVAVGFSPSAYGIRLISEVKSGCSKATRGKPEKLQELGRLLLAEPDHRGVARLLRDLWSRTRQDPAFKDVQVDYPAEYWDAVRLGGFRDVDEGLSELAHRRANVRRPLPSRAISTVHKAKGLECQDVVIVPCDSLRFADRDSARCALYVAISRATESLTLVVPIDDPSPLISV